MAEPTLGTVAGRVARDKVSGCITTIFVFGLGVVVFLVLPPSMDRYFGIVLGGVFAAIGLVASRRGVSIVFVVPFLPLWSVGLAMAAVGCWKAWGRWGLFGAVPIGLAAIAISVSKIRRALRAPNETAPGS